MYWVQYTLASCFVATLAFPRASPLPAPLTRHPHTAAVIRFVLAGLGGMVSAVLQCYYRYVLLMPFPVCTPPHPQRRAE